MIFLFLHPLNYLHAPNVLIGIPFLKANSWFPQGNENAGGVVLTGTGILRHALCPPPLLRSDAVLSITWWGSHVKTYKIQFNLINYPSDNSLAASFFTPLHLRDLLQSLINKYVWFVILMILTKTTGFKDEVLGVRNGRKAGMKMNV